MFKQFMILSFWALLCVSAQHRKEAFEKIQPQEDVQLLHPHVITIERLENLLRRAGQIFRPVSDPTNTVERQEESQNIQHPTQYMQPPSDQPYNFYLPLFDYEDTSKLDAKSRKMEKFAPPPIPQDQYNYYAAKPKKSPKKFNAAAKQINVKWLNMFEKAGGELPKAMYLEQDEHNRINFDDSFFAVDMQVKIPDNQPHSEVASSDMLNHGEEFGEEDLMAAPAVLVPQVVFNYKATKHA